MDSKHFIDRNKGGQGSTLSFLENCTMPPQIGILGLSAVLLFDTQNIGYTSVQRLQRFSIAEVEMVVNKKFRFSCRKNGKFCIAANILYKVKSDFEHR